MAGVFLAATTPTSHQTEEAAAVPELVAVGTVLAVLAVVVGGRQAQAEGRGTGAEEGPGRQGTRRTAAALQGA